MGGSQRMRPAHFLLLINVFMSSCLKKHVFMSSCLKKHVFMSPCLKKHVFMSCHANVCTNELCVYASFCTNI